MLRLYLTLLSDSDKTLVCIRASFEAAVEVVVAGEGRMTRCVFTTGKRPEAVMAPGALEVRMSCCCCCCCVGGGRAIFITLLFEDATICGRKKV